MLSPIAFKAVISDLLLSRQRAAVPKSACMIVLAHNMTHKTLPRPAIHSHLELHQRCVFNEMVFPISPTLYS